MKGGYKIIDLRSTPFIVGGATMTLEGIYDAIEARYGKPILLEGLNVAGIEYGGTWVNPELSGSNYVIKAYNFTITITDTDSISVTNA